MNFCLKISLAFLITQTALFQVATASSQGATELTLPTYIQDTCIIDANDPFEPNLKMQSGPMKGYCINPLKRRSAQILSNEQAAKYFEIKADHMVIANFRHQEKFWVAQIPIKQVKNVILQVQYFPLQGISFVEIAHTQLRFDMMENFKVELVEQSQAPGTTPQRLSLSRMLFSVENIGPYGEAFDAMKGFKGYYNIAYRAVSLDDKYDWMVRVLGHEVKQMPLNLSSKDSGRLLERALNEADYWSTSRGYHTLNPNCATELFVIIDEVMGIKHQPIPSIPNAAPHFLKTRELMDWKINFPTLNEEYEQLN